MLNPKESPIVWMGAGRGRGCQQGGQPPAMSGDVSVVTLGVHLASRR